MTEAPPTGRCLIEGHEGPLVTRRILLFRRLEPGDVHTPGALPVPESSYLEAQVRTIGIGVDTLEEMKRLYALRDAVLEKGEGAFLTTYEPAGAVLSVAGALAFGGWLDYLPKAAALVGAGVGALGVVLAIVARVRHNAHERATTEAWEKSEEREAYEAMVARVEAAWGRYAKEARARGFRDEIRLGEEGKGVDHLATMDKNDWLAPQMWEPDPEGALRYEAVYAGGRSIERVLPEAQPFVPEPSVPEAEAEAETEAETEAEPKPEQHSDSEEEE